MTPAAIKRQLRKLAEQQRAEISAETQKQASLQILEILRRQAFFLNCQNLACYLPKDREIDPQPLIEFAYQQGKTCFLPILDPSQTSKLLFAKYQPGDLLKPNRFGILEPSWTTASLLSSVQLDLVFLPLLAFDKTGQRLGRGGGYYDQSFAYFKDPSVSSLLKPKLIGLAYDFQEIASIPQEPWDVKLDGVITNTKYINLSTEYF